MVHCVPIHHHLRSRRRAYPARLQPTDAVGIIEHSDAKLIFVNETIWRTPAERLPKQLVAAIEIQGGEPIQVLDTQKDATQIHQCARSVCKSITPKDTAEKTLPMPR